MADRWIRARLGCALSQVDAALAEYRFDLAATALYEFAWYEFCDWYLEFTKPVLQSATSSPAAQAGTRRTLLEILEALMRALHPFMPFITEEIWQRVAALAGRTGPSVMVAPWPDATDYPRDAEAERAVDWVQKFVLGVRQIRGELDLAPSRKVDVLLQNASAEDLSLVDAQRLYLERLAGLGSLRPLRSDEAAPESAPALVGAMTVLLPLTGLIDPAAEVERLDRRIAKTQGDLDKTRAKLANANFLRNAPPDVVATDRAREAELRRAIASLDAQLARVRRLLQ